LSALPSAELDEIERLAAEAMAGDPFALVEAVARLCAMRDDPGMTWDLSDNDQAALRLVLEAYGAGNAARTAVPALVAEVRRLRTQNADMLAQHTNAEHVIGETMGEARAARIDRDAAIAQVERMREAGDALAEVANGSDERSRDEEIAAWKAAR
jgi:hypothetical protein